MTECEGRATNMEEVTGRVDSLPISQMVSKLFALRTPQTVQKVGFLIGLTNQLFAFFMT